MQRLDRLVGGHVIYEVRGPDLKAVSERVAGVLEHSQPPVSGVLGDRRSSAFLVRGRDTSRSFALSADRITRIEWLEHPRWLVITQPHRTLVVQDRRVVSPEFGEP